MDSDGEPVKSRNIPAAEDHAGSQPNVSDLLSDYDDLSADETPNTAQTADPITHANRERHVVDSDTESAYSDHHSRQASPPPMLAQRPTPPHLNLQAVDIAAEQDYDSDSESPRSGQAGLSQQQINKPLPKSPSSASPFASFFGWGNKSPSGADFSPTPSPLTPSGHGGANESPDRSKTNAFGTATGYNDHYHIEEMEEELKAISSELAASIRREMDLEDLVDRLQEQTNTQAPSKRTSDYFSDSGYSSAKASDVDASREEIEKVQRRAEQEKASIRLELTNKLQDERSIRKALDQQIKDLSEKASSIDLEKMNNMNASGRVHDLETTCEDLRRRLSEERSSRTNFEDLLSALRGELHDACNERDNLRDEVVPQLRARVEGLETESAEYANLTYESTKMQQELQSLRQENSNLRSSSGEAGSRTSRVMSGGLSRSNSVATGALRNQRGMGLSRSNSVKTTESREALAERLKDVEAQRDALHNALKNLLERQEFQNRENQKKIQVLETERQRLLSGSPKKGGFERDIKNLRTEVNVLRRRAEDALEEKWQVEKGLSGLKTDLDRAEGEIADLRALLNEKDILIPESIARSSGSNGIPLEPVTSESLNEAHRKLQAAYADSLERIRRLESSTASDEMTQQAMQRLERALASARTERDATKSEIDMLKRNYNGLASNEAKSVEAERVLADELSESAHQVEQLASQVQQQLSANADLRHRLADAVARGDAERQANNGRIAAMMENLRVLEDQLIIAQSTSEERVARHEEELTQLRDAHNEQLRRMNGGSSIVGMRSPGLKKNNLLNRASRSRFPGSPRLEPAQSFEDETEMRALRKKVAELEVALADAEDAMQEVVARMNTAQVEVMNLQEERDAAVRDTRRLQKILETEKMKSFEDRFKTLTSTA